MQNQSPLERFPMPLFATALAAALTVVAWYAFGSAALIVVVPAFPIPLFVFWMSWGKTERESARAVEVPRTARVGVALA